MHVGTPPSGSLKAMMSLGGAPSSPFGSGGPEPLQPQMAKPQPEPLTKQEAELAGYLRDLGAAVGNPQAELVFLPDGTRSIGSNSGR